MWCDMVCKEDTHICGVVRRKTYRYDKACGVLQHGMKEDIIMWWVYRGVAHICTMLVWVRK